MKPLSTFRPSLVTSPSYNSRSSINNELYSCTISYISPCHCSFLAILFSHTPTHCYTSSYCPALEGNHIIMPLGSVLAYSWPNIALLECVCAQYHPLHPEYWFVIFSLNLASSRLVTIIPPNPFLLLPLFLLTCVCGFTVCFIDLYMCNSSFFKT